MKRRRFLVLSAGCMMGLLSACGLPMSENVQVEELLRAPRLPGDYGALQNALNEWLGESAQLKYPMQGELLSPFLLQDLDGDGQQDAAVLYTTAQSSNVCIAFLQKDAAGVWQVRQSIFGRIKLEREQLEEKRQELELRQKSPVRSEDRARELVQRFIETAGESRELLVSLIERVELTEDKEILIKFRFAQLNETTESQIPQGIAPSHTA